MRRAAEGRDTIGPAPVDEQQPASRPQKGRDPAQRRPPVGQVAGRVQADRGIVGPLGELVEAHDVLPDEAQVGTAPARGPAARVRQLRARQVDADDLGGGVIGQPRRQRPTAAGHVEDASNPSSMFSR
jgi:hypothetical protein